jgi:hypothetical protein
VAHRSCADAPGCAALRARAQLRLLVTPALDRSGRTPATAGWAGGRPHRRRDPPAELILLPAGARVCELKAAAQSALQQLYPCMEGYVVESVDGVLMNGDRCRVQPRPGNRGLEVWGRGCAALLGGPLRYEGGTESWVVRCGCGVADDDGERMVACDACGVWKHTRCEGVPDDAPPPPAFVCAACVAARKEGGGSGGGGTAMQRAGAKRARDA